MEITNEPQVVGGIFDNLLKGLLGNLKPDFTKVDKVKLKQGIGLALDSLKTTISGSLDDMLIDAVKSALDALIDGLGTPTPNAPLVVGAKKKRTKEDVGAAILAEGGDPTKFAPWLMLVLQFAPQIIELIRKLLGK